MFAWPYLPGLLWSLMGRRFALVNADEWGRSAEICVNQCPKNVTVRALAQSLPQRHEDTKKRKEIPAFTAVAGLETLCLPWHSPALVTAGASGPPGHVGVLVVRKAAPLNAYQKTTLPDRPLCNESVDVYVLIVRVDCNEKAGYCQARKR